MTTPSGQLHAERSNELAFIRERVPEFEPHLRAWLNDQYCYPSSFAAMVEFGEWLARQDDSEVLKRGFAAIEDLLVMDDARYQLSLDLADEALSGLATALSPAATRLQWLLGRWPRPDLSAVTRFFGPATTARMEDYKR